MVETYCEGGVNSTGRRAQIWYEGRPSLLFNDFSLVCSNVPDMQFGAFFYGAHSQQIPWGNGFRCTAGQVWRLPIRRSSDGLFRYDFDLTQPPAPASGVAGGEVRYFQCWYRDAGHGFNLSDGLRVEFCH